MKWIPNDETLSNIRGLLRQADSTDSKVQRELAEAVSRLDFFLLDTTCYYCYILTECVDESADVRQRAGLLLKGCISRLVIKAYSDSEDRSTSEREVLDYIQKNVTKALLDPSPQLRATAGTIITTLALRRGPNELNDLYPFLLNLLDNSNNDIVLSGLDTLIKIIEDEIDHSSGTSLGRTAQENQTSTAQLDETSENLFYKFCHNSLIPKLISIARADPILQKQCKALICLNHFQRGSLFSPNSTLHQYFGAYWETLGILANQEYEECRILVLAGIMHVLGTVPDVPLEQLDHLLPFILDCLDPATQSYDVRLQCLELLSALFRNKQSYPSLLKALNQLIPLLVENTRYSDQDYMQMDRNQFIDDNALEPDSNQDIAPVFRENKREHGFSSGSPDAGYEIEDDDEDLENEDDSYVSAASTWGSGWTVRKVSAMILDHCAIVLGNAILIPILPIIEVKLQSEEWEIKESAVLTLGAIARGCIDGLNPYLPKIIDILLHLCSCKRPILRTISLWTLSRFSLWICPQPEVLNIACRTILTFILDSNKRVQEAACSAFASLEEDAGELLIPYLPFIIQTFSTALKTYQTKNKFVLLDAIGTLGDSIGSAIDVPEFYTEIFMPLVEKWNSAEKCDPLMILSFECINCIIRAVKNSISPYTKVLTERSFYFVSTVMTEAESLAHGTLLPEHMAIEKTDRELVECSFDLLSALCEADAIQLQSIFLSNNVITLLLKYCEVDINLVGPTIKQGCFALIGDLAEHCSGLITPYSSQIISNVIPYISHESSSVSYNGSWAIGQIALHACKPHELAVYAEEACRHLSNVVLSPKSCENITKNSCITLGRIAIVCPAQALTEMSKIFNYWCMIMTATSNYNEKYIAIRGLCNIIECNKNLAVEHMSVLLELMASLYSPHSAIPGLSHTINIQNTDMPPETHNLILKLLQWLKSSYTNEWEKHLSEVSNTCQAIIAALMA